MNSRRWTQFVGTVGAVANWGIPAAAITNAVEGQDPEKIDAKMTSVLFVYSFLFMRWSLAIDPPNYPLLAMHASNEIAQLWQFGRYVRFQVTGQKDQGLRALLGFKKEEPTSPSKTTK